MRGNFGLCCSLARICLASTLVTLDCIVMQMRKINRVKGYCYFSGDPYGYDFFWIPQYLTRYVSLVAGKYQDIVAGKMTI